MTAAVLNTYDAPLTFTAGTAAVASGTACSATSLTSNKAIDYFGDATTYSMATLADSGNNFGMYKDATGVIFVKKLGTTFSTGW